MCETRFTVNCRLSARPLQSPLPGCIFYSFSGVLIMLKRNLARFAGLSVMLTVVLHADRILAAEISLSSLLDDMTNLSGMAEFPNPPFVAKQFSSYDRASTTPADPKTWFANNDCGNYLRVEERNGHKEYVMADMAGPGGIGLDRIGLDGIGLGRRLGHRR